MKKLYLRRVLAIAFVMALMLSFAMPALAADYVEAVQSSSVYSSASSASSLLGTLSKGSVVEKIGVSGIWTKVIFGNQIGYMLTSNVKSWTGTSSTTSSSSSALYATAAVNVRSGPGTSYSIISALAKGQAVVGKGEVSGWMAIEWNGGLAYVHASYLSSSASTASGTWVKATVPLNVRSGPGTRHSIIGGLARNETIEKLGTSGNWTKVNYKGTTAYVSSTYVTAASAPSTTTTTPTAPTQSTDLSNRLYAVRRTDIRSGPGTGYIRIGELDAGNYIDYAGTTSGSWYKVQFGSHNAYVYSYDVQFYNSYYGSGTSVYVTGTTAVYSSMSSSSSILGYLYSGNSVTKSGSSNSTWTGIWYNGQQGYVYTSYLSSYSGSMGTGTINAYWYSISSNVPCYSTKSTSSVYLEGYLSYGERVWVKYADSTWAECTINGKTMYVRVSDLTDDSSYYNGYYSGSYARVYSITPSFNNADGTSFYRNIPSSASLRVHSGINKYGYVEVSWYEGSAYYNGYVYYNDIY